MVQSNNIWIWLFDWFIWMIIALIIRRGKYNSSSLLLELQNPKSRDNDTVFRREVKTNISPIAR
jgi:hypothetical protein